MVQNGKYRINMESRVTKLEGRYDNLSEILREIKDNHLNHIENKIDRAYWFAFTTLMGILVTLIVVLIKK